MRFSTALRHSWDSLRHLRTNFSEITVYGGTWAAAHWRVHDRLTIAGTGEQIVITRIVLGASDDCA